MLSVLRVERARLQLSLWRLKDPAGSMMEPIHQAIGVCEPPIDELVYLRARVTNFSGELCHLSLIMQNV